MVSARDLSNIERKLRAVGGDPRTITDIRRFKKELQRRASAAKLSARERRILKATTGLRSLKRFGSALGLQKQREVTRLQGPSPEVLRKRQREARLGIRRAGTTLGEFQQAGGVLGGRARTIADIQTGRLRIKSGQAFVTPEGIVVGPELAAKKVLTVTEQRRRAKEEAKVLEFVKAAEERGATVRPAGTELIIEQVARPPTPTPEPTRDASLTIQPGEGLFAPTAPTAPTETEVPEPGRAVTFDAADITIGRPDIFGAAPTIRKEPVTGIEPELEPPLPFELVRGEGLFADIESFAIGAKERELFLRQERKKKIAGIVGEDIDIVSQIRLGAKEGTITPGELDILGAQPKALTIKERAVLGKEAAALGIGAVAAGGFNVLGFAAGVPQRPAESAFALLETPFQLPGLAVEVAKDPVFKGIETATEFALFGKATRPIAKGVGATAKAVRLAPETFSLLAKAKGGKVGGRTARQRAAKGKARQAGVGIFTKAELGKISRLERFDPRTFRTDKGTVGVRLRFSELKQAFTKERVIEVSPKGIKRITDVQLARRGALTTLFDTGESFISKGSQKSLRKQFAPGKGSQILSTVRGAAKVQQEFILRQSQAIEGFSLTKRKPKRRAPEPRFDDFKPTQTTILKQAPIEEILPRQVQKRQPITRKGFRPGTLKRLEARGFLKETGKADIGAAVKEGFFGTIDLGRKRKLKKAVFFDIELVEPRLPPTAKGIFDGPRAIIKQPKRFTEIFKSERGVTDLVKPSRRIGEIDIFKKGTIESRLSGAKLVTEIKPLVRPKARFRLKQPKGLLFRQQQDVGISFKQAPAQDIFVSQKPSISFDLGFKDVQQFKQPTRLKISSPLAIDTLLKETTTRLSITGTRRQQRIIQPITEDIFKPTRRIKVPKVPKKPPAKPKPFLARKKGKKKSIFEEKKETGFNVFLIEKGKVVKANQRLLPRKEAVRLGRDIADNSLSASFRVSRTKKQAPSSRRSRLATGLDVSPLKFRKGKSTKTSKFFVEKRGKRLDSPGEKAGITAARLIRTRKKAAKGAFIF